MCDPCPVCKTQTQPAGWPYFTLPTPDAILAQNVRNAMLALAAAADAARKAGLAVDFMATPTDRFSFSPVDVLPGTIRLREISRTTTHKVVL